jgi:hypothetical protein
MNWLQLSVEENATEKYPNVLSPLLSGSLAAQFEKIELVAQPGFVLLFDDGIYTRCSVQAPHS